MASRAGCILLAVALLSASSQPRPAAQQPASAFTDRAASTLLRQLSEALQGHSEKKFLALFDLSRVKDSMLFRQQLDTFFFQTESIRVHMNLVESAADGEGATLLVDAEMELEPRSGGTQSRRNEQLTLAVTRAGNAWKFVDARPRSFFSLP